jgi:hypothetical protein
VKFNEIEINGRKFSLIHPALLSVKIVFFSSKTLSKRIKVEAWNLAESYKLYFGGFYASVEEFSTRH